jgi:hypothetical protein
MRFVGVLAIEGEAQSAENPHFQGFLLFPATARAVSGPKFRSAAWFYPKKSSCLRTPIRAEAAGWEAEKPCI